MSYAPQIWIKLSNDIMMRLRCPGSCVGLGFWNLVKWKKQNNDTDSNNICVKEPDLHSMIHICDAFNLMSKVDISFGSKNDETINDIYIEIRNRDNFKSDVLYQWSQPPISSNSNSNSMPMLDNSNPNGSHKINNRKRSFSNTRTDLTFTPPSKKQKLN